MATKPATGKRSKKQSHKDDQMTLAFGGADAPDAPVIPPEPDMPPARGAKKKKKKSTTKPAAKAAAKPAKKTKRKFATAESMSKAQREISVSEFFAKNRHLLGFDNKRKALLTTVKEAVDNSLDACEEAGILPDIHVGIAQKDNERFTVTVRDNGPGIVKQQIPNIFGKLLYGSKFHRLKMSRGQQGIGISAAGMYGLLTTGKSVRIVSRTSKRSAAHYYELQIDTKSNKPQIVKDKTIDVDWDHGTEVTIELVAAYQKGRSSVDEYIELTAIANPHAYFTFADPNGNHYEYPRGTETAPEPVSEIKPHPYGIELGVLIKMLKETSAKTVAQFLTSEFSRVSPATAANICKAAKVSARGRPTRIGTHEAETLYKAMQETKIRPPSTNCLSPIGPEQILAGLLKGVKAEFFTAASRPPTVYRGNPFQIEVGLAFGGELGPDPSENGDDEPTNEAKVRRGKVVAERKGPSAAKLMRFANRVPLLFQASGCCISKSVTDTDWRRYGMSQPSGGLPQGPLAIFVHMASVWVPFTSEGKEAIADYDEIRKEVKKALQDCGRKLQTYLNKRRKHKYETERRNVFGRYIAEVASACNAIDPNIDPDQLMENLQAVAARVTAKADEKVELIGAEKKGRKLGGDDDAPASEFGENTIVVDGAAGEAGPLFEGDDGDSEE